MRSFLAIAIILSLGACAIGHDPARIGDGRPMPQVTRSQPPQMPGTTAAESILFWSAERRSAAFRNMEAFFPGHEVGPSPEPRFLPRGRMLPDEVQGEIRDLMTSSNAAGFIVLKDGRILFEDYALGFGPEQRWTSFSVAKSITSTLLGAAIRDGYIESLQSPVTEFVPQLSGTAYEGVTVGQIATMTSGVKWNEDYTNADSDVAKMLAVPPRAGESQAVTYAHMLTREAPAGSKWVYKTLETNLLGLIVEQATRQSLASYAAEKIVGPAGFAGGLFWMEDLTGGNIGGCCLSLRLSDYARYGQWVLEGAHGIVPDRWFASAGTSLVDLSAREPGLGYGYQWWAYPGGAFGAQGIFGQAITILPEDKMVVAVVSNWPMPASTARRATYRQLVEKIARAARSQAE